MNILSRFQTIAANLYTLIAGAIKGFLSSLRVGLIKDLSLTLKYVRISDDGGSRLFPRSGPTERLFNIHAQKAKPKQLEPKHGHA